jgi:hypothetical protein
VLTLDRMGADAPQPFEVLALLARQSLVLAIGNHMSEGSTPKEHQFSCGHGQDVFGPFTHVRIQDIQKAFACGIASGQLFNSAESHHRHLQPSDPRRGSNVLGSRHKPINDEFAQASDLLCAIAFDPLRTFARAKPARRRTELCRLQSQGIFRTGFEAKLTYKKAGRVGIGDLGYGRVQLSPLVDC